MNSSRQPQTSPDARLARWAARRHNVVTVGELRTLGFRANEVAYRLRVGRLHQIHRGVYSVGVPTLTMEGRFLAAVRALGDGAALSHRAAAALFGIRDLRASEWKEIDVTVSRRIRRRPGIRPHVARLDASEVTERDGILVTTVPRTLVDLAGELPEGGLRRIVNEALVQRRVTMPVLHRAVEAARGRRGIGALRALLPQAAPTRSELEDQMLAFLARHRLPQPATNVAPPGIGFEVDFVFPELALVIETDGGQFHDTPLARAEDARKQALLEAAGLRVLRIRPEEIGSRGETLTARRIRRVVDEQARLCDNHRNAAPAPETSPVRRGAGPG